MRKEFKSVADILSKDKEFSKFRNSIRENDVVFEFHKIFPEFSKTVTASNINKGTLYLIIDNSVLRNELYLKKSLMIEKINQHYNQQIVVDVKFTNFRNINRNTK